MRNRWVSFFGRAACAMVLPWIPALGAAQLLVPDGPPEWVDEAPVLSRLVEEGYSAQQAKLLQKAAESFCTAARYGSAEAQYRLGRLYEQSKNPAEHEQGLSVLALAAQLGHAKAQERLEGARPLGVLPDCMLTGAAPVLAQQGEAHLLVVPSEVVDRYVLALPSEQRRHALLIQRLAPRFEVDGRLALAIARTESNFNPNAVSVRNAQGLMQLLPETATRFGVRNSFDPEQNVRGGLAYLRWLLARFEGNVALASAAYNAGEGAVDRYGGVPPYNETQAYVQRILNFYRSPKHVTPLGPK